MPTGAVLRALRATVCFAILCPACWPAGAHAFQTPIAPRGRQSLGPGGSARSGCLCRPRAPWPQMQVIVDPFVANLVLGGIAGAVSNTIVFPLDLAKTKIQQSAKEASEGPLSALAQIVRTDGVRGLWAGATPVLLGSAPESAIQLASHTWLVAFAAASLVPGEAQLPLWSQVACGG